MNRTRRSLVGLAVIGLCLVPFAVAQEADLTDEPVQPQTLAEPDAGEVIDATGAVESAVAEPSPADAVEQADLAAPDLTPPDLGPLQVTIYTDGKALVMRRELFTLSVGQNHLELDDIASRLDPTSVRWQPVEPRPDLQVLEQSSAAGTATSAELLTAAIGDSVRVRDGRYTVEGQLVGVDEDGILLAAENELHLHPPGEVILNRQTAPSLEPRLSWEVETEQAGPVEAMVSYLTDGLTWAADYALTVGDDDRMLSFEGWVRVENLSGGSFHRAGLIFADRPSGVGEEAPPPLAERGPRYFLPRQVDLPSAGAKRFALVRAPAAGTEVQYLVTLQPTAPVDIRLVAELTNSAGAGLGVPLPPGPVRLYAPDRVGRLELVGEQQVAATGLDETLRFDLGPADDIDVAVQNIGVADNVIRRVVTLRNLRTEAQRIRVVEQRPGAWSITNASTGFTPPAGGEASAEVTVPANGTETLEYQLRLNPAATEGSAT